MRDRVLFAVLFGTGKMSLYFLGSISFWSIFSLT